MPQLSPNSPSYAPNNGLRAWFLPRGVRPPIEQQPMSGKTVLLVEDSRHASDALRIMCQRLGARLRRAETLEQARAHLRTYRPDAVVIDLGLPDGRGEDLITDLALRPGAPLIIAMSGDDTARGRALRAGASGFLAKPLQSLGEFHAALCPAQACQTEEETISVDPMSLRDDLRTAATLLADPATDQVYAIGFVNGVARMAGDAELRRLALGAADDPAGIEALRQAVARRLGQSLPI